MTFTDDELTTARLIWHHAEEEAGEPIKNPTTAMKVAYTIFERGDCEQAAKALYAARDLGEDN